MHVLRVWSAASRVNGGRARSCGESVTHLRDVGFLSLEVFDDVCAARKVSRSKMLRQSERRALFGTVSCLGVQPSNWPRPDEHVGHERSTAHDLNFVVSSLFIAINTGLLGSCLNVDGGLVMVVL